VGNANEFKRGRELSAWLGLVPRQHCSGNRNVLLGISKRADRYLRTLLIHGARSALCRAERRSDRRSIWASRLKLARGFKCGGGSAGQQERAHHLGATYARRELSANRHCRPRKQKQLE
jgi:hypothetical protein